MQPDLPEVSFKVIMPRKNESPNRSSRSSLNPSGNLRFVRKKQMETRRRGSAFLGDARDDRPPNRVVFR